MPAAAAKPKAKAKAKLKPNGKRSPLKGEERTGPVLVKEQQDLCMELFALSDKNSNGTIGFTEFLQHHGHILSHGAAACMTGTSAGEDKLENMFRIHDADNSGGLDQTEFLHYMEAVFSVVGKSSFTKLCQDLVSETAAVIAAKKAGFDRIASERLLEQARGAYTYKPQLQEKALGLLDSNADPNFLDPTGSHMLLYAADRAASDELFILKLLQRGADPSIHNKDMECAAFKAAKVRDLDVLKMLLIPEQRETPVADEGAHAEKLAASNKLVADVSSCSPQEVRDLLSRKANVNHRHENGWTALTAAVFWGRRDCVEVMLTTVRTAAGLGTTSVNMNVRNAKGRAALHIAARKGQVELLPLLLKAKADPDLQDTEGWTALHHAIFNGQSQAVEALLQGNATLMIKGIGGLTPYMVSRMPEAAGRMSEKIKKQLEPSEEISFAKGIVPVLKDEDLTLFGKLQALLDIRSVNQGPQNLRMHEQFFDPSSGPNKVRLTKTFEELASPLIQRMSSGWTELDEPTPNMSEDVAQERLHEIRIRQKMQKAFVKQWLWDTKGIRETAQYKHDNRGHYAADLNAVINQELEKFRLDFDRLYASSMEKEGGDVLRSMPAVEVINPKGTSQLGVHPLVSWLEQLNPAEAFDALRMVAASGMGKDDDDSLSYFVDLIANGEDFATGLLFWKNVYKLWLCNYAKLADSEFQKKMKSIVAKYNEQQQDQSMEASYRAGPVKTFTQMAAKERSLGEPTASTYEGRTVAAKILDVVRCSITVKSPQAALELLNDFRKLDPNSDRMELMQVVNRWNKDSETLLGYRDLELNVSYNMGLRSAACERQGKQHKVAIIGEVTIVLEDFLQLKRSRSVLYNFTKGYFDWVPGDIAPGDNHGDDEFVTDT